MARLNLIVTSFLFASIARATTFCIEDDILKKDVSLRKTAFARYNNSEIYRCASSCLVSILCKSFHLEIDTRLCVLFHRNSSQVDVTPNQGVIFSDIARWPQSLAGACNGHACSNIRACVPLQKGKTVCDHVALVDVGEAQHKFYKIFTDDQTWHVAEERCQNESGQLLVVSTQREIAFFEALLTDAGRISHLFWVGARRTDTGWRWLNGQQISADHILHGESKGDCILFEFGFGMVAKDCTKTKRYICEFNGSG